MLSLFDTPWKFNNGLSALVSYPFVRLLFLFYQIERRGGRFVGIPIIQKHRYSTISLGRNIQLRLSVDSNPLGANHPVILCTWQENAVIEIRDNCGMTGGFICSARKIRIGNRVSLGANCSVTDTDFHPLDPLERRVNPQKANTSPVEIEDDVFIGMGCTILKGVRIGKGSVIGAGSVVTRSIPPGVIAAGNPAQVIKRL